jgi:hypothetical protein
MSFGNNGAAAGAQPAAGPLGAPIFGNQGPTAAPVGPGAVLGQAGAPPNGASPFYQTSFESVMAAVSRGELPLNITVGVNSYFGGNNANAQQGNPTLMQAISQGPSQNGTNGLNGVVAGGGTVNASFASANTSPGTFDNGFDSTAPIDPKQMINSGTVTLSSPVQYGGN